MEKNCKLVDIATILDPILDRVWKTYSDKYQLSGESPFHRRLQMPKEIESIDETMSDEAKDIQQRALNAIGHAFADGVYQWKSSTLTDSGKVAILIVFEPNK